MKRNQPSFHEMKVEVQGIVWVPLWVTAQPRKEFHLQVSQKLPLLLSEDDALSSLALGDVSSENAAWRRVILSPPSFPHISSRDTLFSLSFSAGCSSEDPFHENRPSRKTSLCERTPQIKLTQRRVERAERMRDGAVHARREHLQRLTPQTAQ
ncbi:hypothetical protein EYF80_001815 [Liparis tanakae]|uniref:Uncharacterized protein n=1 Tax=Liparis tanakae TaxID=230148 RepID=A0A4Z2JCV7_9TELE|nr:hypothetical protein EYF80_001815 [Liparis tanakae]